MIYVKRGTNLLVEAKFFDGYAFIKTAFPGIETIAFSRIPIEEFEEEFDEYWDDAGEVFEYVSHGLPANLLN